MDFAFAANEAHFFHIFFFWHLDSCTFMNDPNASSEVRAVRIYFWTQNSITKSPEYLLWHLKTQLSVSDQEKW